MRPEVFRLEKNFENQQKHQKRRSACVGQGDFGKLELNNIRNDSSNSQHLSVLSVKRDQFETSSIRNKRGQISDLCAFVDGRGNYYTWPFWGLYASASASFK